MILAIVNKIHTSRNRIYLACTDKGMDGRLRKRVLLLAIAFWFRPIARAQAPADTNGQTCMKKSEQSGQVTLLNSQHYRTLLSGQELAAGWTQTPPGQASSSLALLYIQDLNSKVAECVLVRMMYTVFSD